MPALRLRVADVDGRSLISIERIADGQVKLSGLRIGVRVLPVHGSVVFNLVAN